MSKTCSKINSTLKSLEKTANTHAKWLKKTLVPENERENPGTAYNKIITRTVMIIVGVLWAYVRIKTEWKKNH